MRQIPPILPAWVIHSALVRGKGVGNTMISTKKAARFGASCAALALCIGLAAPAHATDEDLWKHQIGIRLANVRSLVAFDADSNFFLAGYRGNIGNENVWFSKYDVSGVLLWRRQLATPEIDRVNGIATDADGNVYLAGETRITGRRQSRRLRRLGGQV